MLGTNCLKKLVAPKGEMLFSRLLIESLEERICRTVDLPCDVDNSGLVEPLDVLILINSLNSRGIQQRASESPEVDWSYDVNSDGWLTPLDALIVINALNRNREPLQIAVHNTVESDPNSNGIVVSDSVSLMGKTSPFSRLTLTSRNETGETGVLRLASTADAGAFRIDFPLSFGRNQIVLRVRDEIGRTIDSVYDVKRGDVIADWNAASLNVVRDLFGVN